MGPLSICLLICLVPSLLTDTVESLEKLGSSASNASWWPV